MTNEQLKNNINFEMYCDKLEQKELLKINNKVNTLINKPVIKECQTDKEQRKLRDFANKTFPMYGIAWKIAIDIINQL